MGVPNYRAQLAISSRSPITGDRSWLPSFCCRWEATGAVDGGTAGDPGLSAWTGVPDSGGPAAGPPAGGATRG